MELCARGCGVSCRGEARVKKDAAFFAMMGRNAFPTMRPGKWRTGNSAEFDWASLEMLTQLLPLASYVTLPAKARWNLRIRIRQRP